MKTEERKLLWGNKGKFASVDPQTMLFFFLFFLFFTKMSPYSFPLEIKMKKICIHFLYSIPLFWILKMKTKYK